jgi:glycosyltransferase involved in cell wall biosynthesis
VYSQYLAAEASRMGYQVELILPKKSGSTIHSDLYQRKLILLTDKTENMPNLLAKLQFLYRQVINPILFLFYLWRRSSNAIVIWNDFEQLTAPFWTFFLKGKNRHAIILHDPDRDSYPPSKSYSEWCMKRIVKKMHLIVYHEYLPNKKYYPSSGSKKYLSIQHGIYPSVATNKVLFQEIVQRTQNYQRWLILGNIREEKNYDLAIETLSHFPKACLIIAGGLSRQGVDIDRWVTKSKDLGVEERVFWDVRYLPESDFQAYIEASDIILLNYQSTFVSQSGILNSIAPYRKSFVYKKGESALSYTCANYRIGTPCEGDDVHSWKESIIKSSYSKNDEEWNAYLIDATWSKAIGSIIKRLE